MEVSKNCIEMVKRFEGLCLKAEKCPAGVPTIGYGHTKNVKMGDTCSTQQADMFLLSDLHDASKEVDKYMKIYNFNQNQYDALVSFAFNVGSIHQLTGKGTRTINQISNKMLLYKKAGGKVLKGLEKRRIEEQKLFNTPCNTTSETKKSYDEIAKEVIKGLWGNGDERKKRLTDAGYQYKRVQNKVNEMLKEK